MDENQQWLEKVPEEQWFKWMEPIKSAHIHMNYTFLSQQMEPSLMWLELRPTLLSS